MATKKINYNGLPEWLQGFALYELEWNGIRAFVGTLPVSRLQLNEGQIEGLPRNPREWTRDDLDNLKASIEETPELYVGRGVLVTPHPTEEAGVALGGNMRLKASQELGYEAVPVVIYPEDTPMEKKLEIVIKDNNTWGRYDWDEIANNPVWQGLPLVKWNTPVWNVPSAGGTSGGSSGGGSDSETGSTTSQRLLLQFNNKKIQMTEEEFEALCARYDEHVAKTGAHFGFVASLLGLDAPADQEQSDGGPGDE